MCVHVYMHVCMCVCITNFARRKEIGQNRTFLQLPFLGDVSIEIAKTEGLLHFDQWFLHKCEFRGYRAGRTQVAKPHIIDNAYS